MKVIFLDTNLFQQCRDLKELPWKEITKENDLLLLVPKTVEDEIDRQKAEGNTRRGKRARKTSAFFREIVLSDDPSFVLKETDPRIIISFPDISPADTIPVEGLDLTRPDDSIISEIYNYKRINPDKTVILLTHDSYPMRMCKKLNIAFKVIPDSWLLPPEPDAKDKKIAELEGRIKTLENDTPIISSVMYCNDEPVNSITITAYKFNKLQHSHIEELVHKAMLKYPMRSDFSVEKPTNSLPHLLSSIYSLQEPSPESISKYTKDQYPSWVETVRKFFEELATNLELCRRHTKAVIAVSNEGSVPAENVIVELTCQSGLQLRYLTKEAKTEQLKKIRLPTPPRPPEAKIINFAEQLRQMTMGHQGILGQNHSHLASVFQREAHDKHAFYFKPHRPPRYSNDWMYECDEFRHQVEPENFNLTLFVPPELTTQKASLHCRITAKNLPSPSTLIIPVKIAYEDGDTMAIANNILNQD